METFPLTNEFRTIYRDIDGKFSRFDGPAIDGDRREFWFNDHWISHEELILWAKPRGIDIFNITKDDAFIIYMTFKDYQGESIAKYL